MGGLLDLSGFDSTYHLAHDVHSRALYTGPGRVLPFSDNSHPPHLDSTDRTRLCCVEKSKIRLESFANLHFANLHVVAVTCIQDPSDHFSSLCLCSPSSDSDIQGHENVCQVSTLVQNPSLRGCPEALDHHAHRQVNVNEGEAPWCHRNCCMEP